MLLDLAQFQNVNQNANMGFTGNHQIKNMVTGVNSNTQFNDHRGGQASQVGNVVQNGNMQIAGNHQFDNFTNNGNTQVGPRTFNPDGSPAQLMLMDLASFNSFNNAGQASFTGEHAIKKLNNAEGGKVGFMDHKSGKGSTVGETANAGDMTIQGNHAFDKFNNAKTGKANVLARAFNKDGSPAKMLLLDLAGFNNLTNQAGGNASFQGQHSIKNLVNERKANISFLDHHSGQASTVGNTNNMGNMNVSGNHQFDNTTNSGNLVASARTFNPDGTPARMMLMDLATFNSFNNAGQASFTGEHAIKKLNNAEGGNVKFNDHKSGKGSTVGETANAGNMQIQGNHAFDKFNNAKTGKANVLARAFDAKGNAVSLLLI